MPVLQIFSLFLLSILSIFSIWHNNHSYSLYRTRLPLVLIKRETGGIVYQCSQLIKYKYLCGIPKARETLKIITILHIIITTTSILILSFKTIAPKILAHTKCINKYWKYTQIFAATKSSKIIKYWRLPKILANTQNIGASWKFRRNLKILALHENSGGISKYWHFMKIQAEGLSYVEL